MSLDNKVVDLADLKVSHDYLLEQDGLLSDRIDELGSGIDGVESIIGDLSNLSTTLKDSIVSAINEVLQTGGRVKSVNSKTGDVVLKTSDLTNDSGYLTSYTETDPTVPSWAKQVSKPTYTAQEVGASSVEDMNSEVNTRRAADAQLQSQITALGNGAPIPVETVAEMIDNTKAYLYTGAEIGWLTGYWYTYDSAQAKFVPRGEYGVGTVIDNTLTVSGDAADAKATGDAISEVNGRLQEYDNLLNIPTDVTFSATSNASWTQTPLGEVTLKNGVTYTFDFFVDEPVGSTLPIVSIRDTAAETTLWNAQMATGTTHKTWTYKCESEGQNVLLRFQIGTSAETTVHAAVTSDEQNVIEQIDSEIARTNASVETTNEALEEINTLLEIPSDITFRGTSSNANDTVVLGETTLVNGQTYNVVFTALTEITAGTYVYMRDIAADQNIWSAQIPVGGSEKSYTYACVTDNQRVRLYYKAGTANTTVQVRVTSTNVDKIAQLENKIKNALNYGSTLFTSAYSANGEVYDRGQATCYKRERKSYVSGIEFACRAYASHTYFCAFDENGDIIPDYTLSGATSVTETHTVTFGDDVCYYSVQTLAANKAASYIKEITDYGAVIVNDEEETQLYKDKTYAAIKAAKMEKWSEMQFGMFIHWGVYSAWAGVYDGPNIDGTQIHVTGGTEWMWHNSKIPKANYMAKAVDFTGAAWNPDYICMLAKSLGMGQIVITARHHEGFSLMETSFCEWDITDSGCTRDVLMDLKNACVRHGIKFSLYVSPLLDWCDEGGYGQQVWNGGSDPYTFAQHKGFVENQIQYMNQLVEKYDPYVIWYDGGTYLNTQVKDDMRRLFDNNQLRIYPYTIVNNRGEGTFDYRLAENTYADYPNTQDKYERCWFLAGWGYNTAHNNINSYRTKQAIIWDMLENMGRGFNYLLNISPKGDGSLPSPTGVRFAELASIFRKYTFFNGAKRIFNWSQPSWGRPIKIGNSIYMFAIPGHNGTLYLDSVLTNNIKGVHVYDISDPDSASNYSVVSDDRLRIDNVPTTSDDYFTVVRVDYYGEPICMDYNIVDSGIRGMSMVRTVYTEWASPNTAVLLDGTYRFGTDASTSVSRFKFAGTTGTYTFAPTGTQSGEVSFTYKLYDAYGVLISEGTTFTLTNGEIYKVEVSKTGSGTLIMNELSINSAN